MIYGALGDHPHVCNELLSKGADVTIANENDVDAYKATIKKDAYTGNTTTYFFLAYQIIIIYYLMMISNVQPKQS